MAEQEDIQKEIVRVTRLVREHLLEDWGNINVQLKNFVVVNNYERIVVY